MTSKISLDQKMKEKGFWAFDFYSPLPVLKDKPVILGSFEIVNLNDNGSYPLNIYVRYLGSNEKFKFLNEPLARDNNRYYYNYAGDSKMFNNKIFCHLLKTWRGPTKNRTYSSTSLIRYMEDGKRYRDGLSRSQSPSFSKEPDVKTLKKAIKEHKAQWEKAKRDVVTENFGISYEEFQVDQIQVRDYEATQFILKVAPLLTRLRDECTLMLDKLNDPDGPSKQAKDDFVTAYQKFQWHYENRTYLTALKTFKTKKGKTKRK